MNFPEWLDEERGRPTMVAAHFDISISAVTQWRLNGVPKDRMLDVRELTGGAVTLDEMVTRPAAVTSDPKPDTRASA